ncbi:PREDICTED: probable tyrosyl-DNA phosphodiesterase [Trachymyrmex septentrionalis]|uniref:probable tyrosyl-DNA phosphodiesterase n=1 Tax=Trachymyrmex septentrionalis TaxID=34720 RepID=UPI00084EF046|nr:PREDICTED: probable tyrosyl-DNA phosphodiesterase [Trachymyrmex septentrionalis]
MAAGTDTHSKALIGEEHKNSESNKTRKKSQETTSEAGSSDSEKNRQKSTESMNNCINDQQDIDDIQINSKNNEGDTSLKRNAKIHSKQQWLESYLYQWKAKRTGRDRAVPHIKSYTRISPDSKNIPWFVLTSANLSKSAWGNGRLHYYIRNYEAGVIFIPKLITGTTTFPIGDGDDSVVPIFPIPYDLPLCRYESSDRPFVCEFLSSLADNFSVDNGNK